MLFKLARVWAKRLAGGSAGVAALATIVGHAEPMSLRLTPAPSVSPTTLSGGSDRQADVLVKKMMLAPPPAMPAALLDVDQLVRGEQPLLNINQLKPLPFSPPMDLKQASNTKPDLSAQ